MEDDEKDDTNPQGMKERKNPEWMKYEKMKLEEKRKLYKCRQNFVMLKDIDTWTEYFKKESYLFHSRVTKPGKCVFPFNKEVNDKVSLWQGDITTLEIDAIVNAANNTLLGGGGVDGCIHRAAGPSLKEECRSLNGCETGQAKISLGHRLPAKFILHTVGPVGEREKKLESCYKSCLELCLKHDVRSVAFCCISTGIFGYPNERAAEVALRTTRQWLEENKDAVDRIIFCLFMDVDIEIYQSLMLKYYPPTPLSQDSSKNEQIEDTDQQATNTQENTPENTQGNTPENTSENTPENTSENISENTPENTSENAPGNTPENTSETTPENTSENTPGNTLENISENTPENASENTPENTSENTPENTSENTPESPSENIPENKSKKLKQDNDQQTDRSQEEMKNASSEEDTAEGHITTPMHVDKPSEEKESLVSTTTTEEQNLTATAETQETVAETTDMDCQLSQE